MFPGNQPMTSVLLAMSTTVMFLQNYSHDEMEVATDLFFHIVT